MRVATSNHFEKPRSAVHSWNPRALTQHMVTHETSIVDRYYTIKIPPVISDPNLKLTMAYTTIKWMLFQEPDFDQNPLYLFPIRF
ncbi:hypothetical protein TNCT_350261 [Trichonephila clavata]|uniref:Uncharacterized protein n=1 Tax=Trichonephila clavata TaxID=2740835 RepID=A0A8X6IU61_TRICU|nr:hypothetical protein TNCT_350261 [Trichonephila clavata]